MTRDKLFFTKYEQTRVVLRTLGSAEGSRKALHRRGMVWIIEWMIITTVFSALTPNIKGYKNAKRWLKTIKKLQIYLKDGQWNQVPKHKHTVQ